MKKMHYLLEKASLNEILWTSSSFDFISLFSTRQTKIQAPKTVIRRFCGRGLSVKKVEKKMLAIKEKKKKASE